MKCMYHYRWEIYMKYGFLGCGNMGSAIARAISKSTNQIMITDRSGKARTIANELNCDYSSSLKLAQECDSIFLAVKPQMMQDAIAPIKEILAQKKPLIITMAAGLSISAIEKIVGVRLPIIRIMPNTPASIGAGMTVFCYNDLVTPAALSTFVNDMRHTGRMYAIPEHLIDAASAVSGSGPAYMYLFLEAMADGAVACGIPRAKAITYAAETMIGAAQLLVSTGQHPGVLKDAVCSPAGSTIEGIRVLEEHKVRSAVTECVIAAYNRNKELGQTLPAPRK